MLHTGLYKKAVCSDVKPEGQELKYQALVGKNSYLKPLRQNNSLVEQPVDKNINNWHKYQQCPIWLNLVEDDTKGYEVEEGS